MAKIGIFWIYKDQVVGKARALAEGEENVPGLIDSPDSHVVLWEQTLGFHKRFPELLDIDYQQVPRGRVLFDRKLGKAVVYMDKVLHIAKHKAALSQFFQLDAATTIYRTDDHYTTDEFFDADFDDEAPTRRNPYLFD